MHRIDGPAVIWGAHESHYLHGVRTNTDLEHAGLITTYFTHHLDLCVNINKFLATTGLSLCDITFNKNTQELTSVMHSKACFANIEQCDLTDGPILARILYRQARLRW